MANEFQFKTHDIEVTIMGQPYAIHMTDALVEQSDRLLKEHSEAVAAAAGDRTLIRAAGRQFNNAMLELTLGKAAVDALFRGRETADMDKSELAVYIAELMTRHLTKSNRAQRRAEQRRKRA